MPRDHYRLKKLVHYIERETSKIAKDVLDLIENDNLRSDILCKLAVIVSYSDLIYKSIEQDRQEKIADD